MDPSVVGPDVGDAGRSGDVTRRDCVGIQWVYEIAMRAAYPNQPKNTDVPIAVDRHTR